VSDGRAIVLFGDVVGSRRDPTNAATWLRDLTGRLTELYGSDALAPFGFTQGDELQGLLRTTAGPLRAVLLGALDDDAPRLRWVAVAGEVADGTGPAPERNGPAFLAAREAIERARRQRDRLLMLTGDERADVLLDDLAPVLGELLDELTDRQRTVARLALVDQLRQSEVAHRLNVSRATISVTFGRGKVDSIAGLAHAIGLIFADGAQRAGAAA
jgi:hypothetical protein